MIIFAPQRAVAGLLALFCVGCASPEQEFTNYHERPIIERDGQTLLWANDEEWFDVTEASIDPSTFQYGIGKDSIASIDTPEFVGFSDSRVMEAGIDRETMVLGIQLEGTARAYPVRQMDRHEVVNDTYGGKAYAILW
ncbi:MAG: hypothetical protein ACI8QC_004095 [Planctomycetota bacterium]|jgi:hypothetical protein